MNNNQDMIEILLVEDNPNDAEMAIRALKEYHLANRVVHVQDGEEALDFVFGRGAYEGRDTKNKPKIILLDLKLPKVNGMEVLKILKSDPATRLIPIIVLTSSSEESDLIESYKLGANSYLVKPVDFDKFCDSIKEVGLYWLLLNKQPGQ
jgi:CheY-like chemotaxis protein